MTLQIRMRFCRLSPHISAVPVGGLKVAGGDVSNSGLILYCICGYTGVGGGGGTRALRRYWRACRVVSVRSTIVSALIMLAGALVRPQSHSSNGFTCC